MSSTNITVANASFFARMWRARDRTGWRNFWIAMLALSAALILALFSAAVAETGRIYVAATSAALALGLAGWVGVAIVPALARRTSLGWLAYQVDYRLTREGIIYLAAVFVLILAAVNTGNNLLFMVLACAIAGILISGVLSRVVLTDVELRFDLPEHIFAEQPDARRSGIAQRKKDAAFVFVVRRRRCQKRHPSNPHAARLFSVHLPRRCRAAESGTHVSEARRIRPGCLWHSHAVPLWIFRKDAACEIQISRSWCTRTWSRRNNSTKCFH